ncbi:MAG: dicarboxylate/amino acid:cation symporter [Desulfurococcaceae archaeon]
MSSEIVFQIRLGKRPLLLLIAAVLGLVAGIIIGEPVKNISILGDIYVSLLKFIVGPLVFLCIAWAVMNMSDLVKLGKIFIGFLPYWLVMGLIAAGTAYSVGVYIKPGEGVQLPGGQAVTPAHLSISDYVKNIIPSNFIDMFLNLRMLQIIFTAILIGVAVGLIGRTTPQVRDFLTHLFEALLAVVYKLLDFILWYGPIGVFVLMANVAAIVGVIAVGAFAKLILAFYVSGFIVFLILQPLVMVLIARINPIRYWKKFYPAMITAFSTASSNATLPVTINCALNSGISRDVATIILPVAATINMQGACTTITLFTLFAFQALGISITFGETLALVVLGFLGATAAAGVPGGAAIVAVATASALGIPVEAAGWMIGVHPAVDPFETMLNVLGDPLGALIVSKYVTRDFDEEKWRK